jgi:DNA polymerase
MEGCDPRAIRQRLESLLAAGVRQLPRPGVHRTAIEAPREAAAVHAEATPAPAPVLAAAAPRHDAADRVGPLRLLRQQVAGCTLCSELAASRTQTVFGAGPPDARLCFLGEAPGADEDATGEPFVGRAGQLLTKIIEACTLARDDVYILNVLKCRPPGNRTPLPAEVDHCRAHFERQLEIIAPEFICCLGTTAAQALLRTAEPIGKLRRRWFAAGSAQVLCTYHPSYLLRNPAAKRDVWEDMKMLMERMGLGKS